LQASTVVYKFGLVVGLDITQLRVYSVNPYQLP